MMVHGVSEQRPVGRRHDCSTVHLEVCAECAEPGLGKADRRIPPPPGWFIEDHQRWAFIRRLLHDEGVDLDLRVAGLLILLFGQRLARIVEITTGDIDATGPGVSLHLGTQPVELPPPLDTLILRLRDAPASTHWETGDRPWLFTGRSPGAHLSDLTLGEQLRALGIQARSARNRTLMDLAADLPAFVLAELLGVHVNTATRWTRQADADGAGYAAELSRRQSLSLPFNLGWLSVLT
jgi:hypothetical protein